jgi:D-arginine dehydrogenase
VLRRDYVASALYEPDVADLDVDALLQGYLRQLRARGGRVVTNAAVDALTHARRAWSVQSVVGTFEAPLLVNAAGAWADELARRAGGQIVGLTPMRRTAILVPMPTDLAGAHLPMVVDCEEQFYLKTEAGKLLLSPADETPVAPHDVAADEWDVAVCIDRVTPAITFEVRAVAHRWAGLRTFAPDRLPVIGFDKTAPNFFWLAGQGGVGLQTAPALAQAAFDLIEGGVLSAGLADFGVDAATFDVGRYAQHENATPWGHDHD